MVKWKRGRNPTTRHANIGSKPVSYIYRYTATIASLWSEGLLGKIEQTQIAVDFSFLLNSFFCDCSKILR